MQRMVSSALSGKLEVEVGKSSRVLIAAAVGIGLIFGPATGSAARITNSANAESSNEVLPALVPPVVPPLRTDTKIWSVADYTAALEKTNGRALTPDERESLATGCIGITTVNIGARFEPELGLSFGTLEQAKKVQDRLDDILRTKRTWIEYAQAVFNDPVLGKLENVTNALDLPNGGEYAEVGNWKTAMFSKRFYSGQDRSWSDQERATKFRPDPNTGQVDMSEYDYHGNSGLINFDYGYIDPLTGDVWHANHKEPGMQIYQSTLGYYSRAIVDYDRQVSVFDRQVFTVVLTLSR